MAWKRRHVTSDGGSGVGPKRRASANLSKAADPAHTTTHVTYRSQGEAAKNWKIVRDSTDSTLDFWLENTDKETRFEFEKAVAAFEAARAFFSLTSIKDAGLHDTQLEQVVQSFHVFPCVSPLVTLPTFLIPPRLLTSSSRLCSWKAMRK